MLREVTKMQEARTAVLEIEKEVKKRKMIVHGIEN